MKTTFAKQTNPWTGEKQIGFTEIPDRPSKGRSTTKYDEIFNELMKMKRAYEVSFDDFQRYRRAAKRFIEYNSLKNICIRQLKGEQTYKMWFEKK